MLTGPEAFFASSHHLHTVYADPPPTSSQTGCHSRRRRGWLQQKDGCQRGAHASKSETVPGHYRCGDCQNHGRIFHTAGDSVIAEFASPVDALVAAVEFQKLLRDRNASCDPIDQLEFRVGLNLGDVIIEEDNLYGEGINIAARIESIARPGGICVAKSVFSEVRKKLVGLEFISRGNQSLKNIDEPIEVFDVSDEPLPNSAPVQSAVPDKVSATSLKPIVSVEPISTVGGDAGITVLAVGLHDGIVSSLSKSSAVLVVKQSSGPAHDAPLATSTNHAANAGGVASRSDFEHHGICSAPMFLSFFRLIPGLSITCVGFPER